MIAGPQDFVMAHDAVDELHEECERRLAILWQDFAARFRQAVRARDHKVVGIEQILNAGKPTQTFTRIDREQVRADIAVG